MQKNENPYEWTVVGAGPAGIAAVGKLIDQGIVPTDILWVDPQFTVGDLGALWANVSSNTTVDLFLHFLNDCKSFDYSHSPGFALDSLPKKETCKLGYMVEPLQWVTQHLRQQVTTHQSIVKTLKLEKGLWHLSTEDNYQYSAKKVILATGAVPLHLSHSGVHVLPFEQAIDYERLRQTVNRDYCYAVFGSSHSAIMIIRHLVELGVKKVINFYRSPCCYAVNMGDWTLFDNTGLKGHTAAWAREHIDGTLPTNLVRYLSSEENITRFLPDCNQVIYAVGFGQRHNITVGDTAKLTHNPHVGIIGPGLFGFGIAYPELKADPFGYVESQVGLWKFMVYLNKVIPVWFKYHA